MKKMAIFVEGQTEQLFVRSLIEAIGGEKKVNIEEVKLTNGKPRKGRLLELLEINKELDSRYYFLIFDCSQDARVLSGILERCEGLSFQGYQDIVGLHDVHPHSRKLVPTIRANFLAKTKHLPIIPLQILSIMEIESWFVAEHTHFQKIHPSLTIEVVSRFLKADASECDVQAIKRPANLLHKIYNCAGLDYKKKRKQVSKTLKCLDFSAYYLTLRSRLPDLDAFIQRLESFFS